MDMNQTIRPRDIEYMTTYPKMGGFAEEKVLIIIGRTIEGERYLIYAPSVTQREVGIEQHFDSQEFRNHRGVVLGEITTSRSLTINNELYVLSDNDTFFHFIFLDKQPAPRIKKGDIEKLFGCVIDG